MKPPNREHLNERTLRDFSDSSAIERLRKLGIEGVDAAFGIDDERDPEGRPIDAEVFWTRFTPPEDERFSDLPTVEGKLYLPKRDGNSELILFTPGMPGGNAGRFEQRYARTFVEEGGYGFFTVRHNGSSLTSPAAEGIMNAHRRLEIASELGETNIGGSREEGYTPEDIVQEPVTPFLGLQGAYQKVHLMGQSMGVAASYNVVSRVRENPAMVEKIGNVVGIAGFVGKTGERDPESVSGLKMALEGTLDHTYKYGREVGMNLPSDPERFRQGLVRVAKNNRDLKVPPEIGNVLVYTPEDPLITGPDRSQPADEAVWKYGPETKRKLLIRNAGEEDAKPHSMLWIKPENLLRAVRAKVSGHGPHQVNIPRNPGRTMESR